MIVGAGAGLGASPGRCFADAGYNIAITARRPERLQELASELSGRGVKAEVFGVDASDQAGIVAAFDAVETNLGPIDLALYNVNGRTVRRSAVPDSPMPETSASGVL